jgi:hypothetical protein
LSESLEKRLEKAESKGVRTEMTEMEKRLSGVGLWKMLF